MRESHLDQTRLDSGDAVLEVRCPICDAPIEAHAAETRGMEQCARCGHAFAADSRLNRVAGREELDEAPGLTVHALAFPGQKVLRLVQRLARRPSFILRTKTNRKAGGPQAIRVPDKPEGRRLFGWLSGPELRRIFFAALVFVGIPAALIFFVIVVCAPEENADARRPVRAERPRPAKTIRPSWLQKLRP
jgi:hypothetical protein